MTTSATGRPRHAQAGFSLLEMIIVLVIIALFGGMLAFGVIEGQTERILKQASGEVKKAALQANRLAVLYRRDHYLSFRPDGITVSDRALSRNQLQGNGVEFRSFPFDPSIKVQLKNPFEPTGIRTENYFWRFRASGLSDPLSVRLEKERSHVDLDFHVLTARATEKAHFE